MLRNIAGIVADEEPKTPISVSGLYNTSTITNLFADHHYFSEYSLAGLSEFAIMAWVRFDSGFNTMYINYGFYNKSGSISAGNFSFAGTNGQNRIDFIIPTSAGTQLNISKINASLAVDTWYHLAVTGSVLNNELKLFKDGQLINSSTMPYSIALPWDNSGTNRSKTYGAVNFYMAQYNVYNRALSEAEVLEHYVYDDDLMTSGVLGFDAMTPAQKSGLIYSSSFIKDISISGNEFKDKSGNGVTLSPQPSLTGDQIYVYTDASDLPSDTQIYNVNSATLNGTSQALSIVNGNSSIEPNSTDWSTGVWFKGSTTTGVQMIISRFSNANIGFDVYVDGANNDCRLRIYSSGSDYRIDSFSNTFLDGNWHFLSLDWNQTSQTFDLYIDNSAVTLTNVSVLGTVNLNLLDHPLSFGYYTPNNDWFFSGDVSFGYWKNAQLTGAQRTGLYSNGIPPCFEDLSFSLDGAWNLSTWTGSNEPTTDQTGNGNNLTEINTPTYADQGLTVECTS